MIILTIVNFFTSLFNIGEIDILGFVKEILYSMLLWLDGAAYTLLSYSFRLFQLMCTLNFNSLQGLISGLLTRIEALIMVFVVYKLGIALINFMLNPDEASKKGKDILINIFITAALLLSYNTIFTLLNEISMLLIGTPENYNFVVLGQIADITGANDIGLVNRLVFGTNEEIPDVGEYIAFSTASVFITDAEDPLNTAPLRHELATEDGHIDFFKLPNIAADIGDEYNHFPIVGFLGALFVTYAFVKATIEIGVRAFKLLILQVLAPVAIITIIGDGVKGKVFKNFISKYISVFIEAFTRMFCILLISNFAVKFIKNIGDYLPKVNTDEWWTYAIMIVLLLVSAFKFAGDVPKFIDEILGTHMSSGSDKNFIGGLLGAGMGAAAGFAGGLAGGGIGSAVAGLGSGLVGGVKAGSKGGNVAEYFKGLKDVNAGAKTTGQNIAARGGLHNVMLGGLQSAAGVGNRQDKKLAALDRQSAALNEYDAALTEAVKDEKADFLTSVGLGQFADAATGVSYYADGYENVKFGEDKDAYAQKMLSFDKDYIKAEANVQKAIENGGSLNINGTNYDVTQLQQMKAKAQQDAENRAKDNYDAAKLHIEDSNSNNEYKENVRSKRESYEKSGGKTGMVPGDIKSEKRRIATSKYEITNKSSYSRTHGQNPNKK